jgi:hypothetical protein
MEQWSDPDPGLNIPDPQHWVPVFISTKKKDSKPGCATLETIPITARAYPFGSLDGRLELYAVHDKAWPH